MNHRPFEDWLIEEVQLGAQERRELEEHLRICARCAALSASGAELRLGQMLPPRSGFVARFKGRLALQAAAERRRRRWGAVVLVVSGLAALVVWAAPYLAAFVAAPVEWITIWIGYLVFLVSSGRALFELSQVFLRVAPGLMPVYGWMILVSTMAGIALIWAVSIWRVARVRGGVRG